MSSQGAVRASPLACPHQRQHGRYGAALMETQRCLSQCCSSLLHAWMHLTAGVTAARNHPVQLLSHPQTSLPWGHQRGSDPSSVLSRADGAPCSASTPGPLCSRHRSTEWKTIRGFPLSAAARQGDEVLCARMHLHWPNLTAQNSTSPSVAAADSVNPASCSCAGVVRASRKRGQRRLLSPIPAPRWGWRPLQPPPPSSACTRVRTRCSSLRQN